MRGLPGRQNASKIRSFKTPTHMHTQKICTRSKQRDRVFRTTRMKISAISAQTKSIGMAMFAKLSTQHRGSDKNTHPAIPVGPFTIAGIEKQRFQLTRKRRLSRLHHLLSRRTCSTNPVGQNKLQRPVDMSMEQKIHTTRICLEHSY